jgi:hypothetical protein
MCQAPFSTGPDCLGPPSTNSKDIRVRSLQLHLMLDLRIMLMCPPPPHQGVLNAALLSGACQLPPLHKHAFLQHSECKIMLPISALGRVISQVISLAVMGLEGWLKDRMKDLHGYSKSWLYNKGLFYSNCSLEQFMRQLLSKSKIMLTR